MLTRLSPWTRDLAAAGLARIGFTSPARRARARLTIATFHRVLPEELRAGYPLPGLAVTPEDLEWFLRFFVQRYTCGTLRDTWQRWCAGEHPERPFLAITFDDGQRDNVDYGLPVLKQHGVHATFFPTAGFVGTGRLLWHDRIGFAARRVWKHGSGRRDLANRLGIDPDLPAVRFGRAVVAGAKQLPPDERARIVENAEQLAGGSPPDWASMMTWEQLAHLAAAGHEVGSHSMTHPLLPECSDAELDQEIAGSRRLLEERLRAPVRSFCYPNGDHDWRSVAAVQRAGYHTAVTVDWGTNPFPSPPMVLRRCDIHPDHARDARGKLSAARQAWRMSGWYPGLAT